MNDPLWHRFPDRDLLAAVVSYWMPTRTNLAEREQLSDADLRCLHAILGAELVEFGLDGDDLTMYGRLLESMLDLVQYLRGT